jgi:hypothetical protein
VSALDRRRVLALALLAGLSAQAQTPTPATPPEVALELPTARLQGSGRLRFIGLRVYEARLWLGPTPLSADWAAHTLALELEYARGLSGSKIAERSLLEMQRQADIAPELGARWLSAMGQMFPDVTAGDRITGVNLPGMGARFFINGRLKGDVRDPEFARLFFGIWLSPKTSEPTLRDALLGKTP